MSFDLLTPYVAMQAVESVIGTPVDGALTGYPSYVNRVYGFGAEDGRQYVAKFYRPGRWVAAGDRGGAPSASRVRGRGTAGGGAAGRW